MRSLLKFGLCFLFLTLYACTDSPETTDTDETTTIEQEETPNTSSTINELSPEQKIDQLIAAIQQKDNLFTFETFEAECGGGFASLNRAIDKKNHAMGFFSINHSSEHGGKEIQYYFNNNNQLVCVQILESLFLLTEEKMTLKQIYLNENAILKANTKTIKGKSVSLEKLEAVSWDIYAPKKEDYTIEASTIQQFKTMDKAGFESYACEY